MGRKRADGVNPADPSTFDKFVDEVPRPEVLEAVGRERGVPVYEVRFERLFRRVHSQFPEETELWGYNGRYPGPTFEVRRDQGIRVRYFNDLPTTHLLPVDHTIYGAEEFRPEVRNVVHLHGGKVAPEFDGHPEAWFTPDLGEAGPEFVTTEFEYPNRQPAASLWYHDHALGITRLNVYAGLAGFYLIREPNEDRLGLPRGEFEVPLLIQDRTFTAQAQLFYPLPAEPEFFGNTILVNGQVWPVLTVQARRYRLRFLNGSNARFYRLFFTAAVPMVQIGTDAAFLPQPVPIDDVLLAPAERADVIIDFSGFAPGTELILRNDAPTPFPDGDPVTEADPTSQIMLFRVVAREGNDRSRIPDQLPAPEPLNPAQAVRTRQLTLNEVSDPVHGVLPLLGIRSPVSGRPLALRMGDSATEMPRFGTVEIWNLINVTGDTHPIHVHLVRFFVLNRQRFNVDRLTADGVLEFEGDPVPPHPAEAGLKDTVQAHPGEVTRIIARYGDFSGDFVWHCHILEHEDNEMMRRYEVVRVTGGSGERNRSRPPASS